MSTNLKKQNTELPATQKYVPTNPLNRTSICLDSHNMNNCIHLRLRVIRVHTIHMQLRVNRGNFIQLQLKFNNGHSIHMHLQVNRVNRVHCIHMHLKLNKRLFDPSMWTIITAIHLVQLIKTCQEDSKFCP